MPTSWLRAALALVVSACEQQTFEPFAELDRNDNGRLSRQEASADPALDEAFSELDVNEDGELSAHEYLSAAARE